MEEGDDDLNILDIIPGPVQRSSPPTSGKKKKGPRTPHIPSPRESPPERARAFKVLGKIPGGKSPERNYKAALEGNLRDATTSNIIYNYKAEPLADEPESNVRNLNSNSSIHKNIACQSLGATVMDYKAALGSTQGVIPNSKNSISCELHGATVLGSKAAQGSIQGVISNPTKLVSPVGNTAGCVDAAECDVSAGYVASACCFAPAGGPSESPNYIVHNIIGELEGFERNEMGTQCSSFHQPGLNPESSDFNLNCKLINGGGKNITKDPSKLHLQIDNSNPLDDVIVVEDCLDSDVEGEGGSGLACSSLVPNSLYCRPTIEVSFCTDLLLGPPLTQSDRVPNRFDPLLCDPIVAEFLPPPSLAEVDSLLAQLGPELTPLKPGPPNPRQTRSVSGSLGNRSRYTWAEKGKQPLSSIPEGSEAGVEAFPPLPGSSPIAPRSHQNLAPAWRGRANGTSRIGSRLQYQNDGADSIKINKSDLLSVEETWGFCLLGFFVGLPPSWDAINSMRDKMPVFHYVKKVNKNWFIFNFDNKSDMDLVLKMGPYFAGGTMMVLKYVPDRFKFDLHDMPLTPTWIRIYNVPSQLWNINLLQKIASKVGNPLHLDEATETKENKKFARVLVEVDCRVEHPKKIILDYEDGDKEEARIEFEYLPYYCPDCKIVGHDLNHCDKGKGINTKKPKPTKSKKSKKARTEKVNSTGQKQVPDSERPSFPKPTSTKIWVKKNSNYNDKAHGSRTDNTAGQSSCPPYPCAHDESSSPSQPNLAGMSLSSQPPPPPKAKRVKTLAHALASSSSGPPIPPPPALPGLDNPTLGPPGLIATGLAPITAISPPIILPEPRPEPFVFGCTSVAPNGPKDVCPEIELNAQSIDSGGDASHSPERSTSDSALSHSQDSGNSSNFGGEGFTVGCFPGHKKYTLRKRKNTDNILLLPPKPIPSVTPKSTNPKNKTITTAKRVTVVHALGGWPPGLCKGADGEAIMAENTLNPQPRKNNGQFKAKKKSGVAPPTND